MKREIEAAQEIDAFARERIDCSGNGESIAEPAPFKWIGGNELTQMTPRRKQMVVDKIIAAGGLTVIASKSKSGKTTLMVEICHAVSTGRAVLGRYSVTQGPVLYWLADDSNVDRFAESWRTVSGDISVENFHLCVMSPALVPRRHYQSAESGRAIPPSAHRGRFLHDCTHATSQGLRFRKG